jgi:hypothetical protein
MADTVDVKTLFGGKRYKMFHLTNQSDGTGEAAVTKVDISTLTDPVGAVCTYTAIDRIEYSVFGMNYVTLAWDHTTDDEIAVLSGQGVMDWSQLGGNVDPRTAGGTGDILLTTNGAAAGAGYDITLYVKPKA